MKLLFVPLVLPLAVFAQDLSQLPPNQWSELHREDNSGGKAFAKAVFAPNTGKIYLWGTGGEKPARNVYRRYELESFEPANPAWNPAFPVEAAWSADDFPPFRIFGQSGPDGLKFDEGPRLKTVGGYHSVNGVQWWDFDGILRPSPILTFNQACWDSKRQRMLIYSDGQTFALDPATNSWVDLKTPNYPDTCKTIAWASMAYDSRKDRILLFGGGLATNPSGGAPTWIYDCARNRWQRPELSLEPPLRCNGALVYDAQSGAFVLFGGYDQAAALNDTWTFGGERDAWRRLEPNPSPPPMFAPAGAAIFGHLLVCGNDARKVELQHRFRSSAVKETWALDVAAAVWKPVHVGIELTRADWLSVAPIGENTVAMVAFGPERRTLALRFDPQTAAAELPGAKPGTVAWKYPEQKQSLENAPAADVGKHAEFLRDLPPNQFIDAKPPGMLISKTWSTATLDTGRSEVIYHGGGHSGYSGNDFARYSIVENRWTLDAPPRFPPFLEGTNAGIFGWSYGMIPFSQHTYLWYCYDAVSKSVVYLARPSITDGLDVRVGEETFVYDSQYHGYASWVYDSAEKKMHPPQFRPPVQKRVASELVRHA